MSPCKIQCFKHCSDVPFDATSHASVHANFYRPLLFCKRGIWYGNKWKMSSVWFHMVHSDLAWDLASSTVHFFSWSGIPACNPVWWETQNLASCWPSLKECHNKLCIDTVSISAWHMAPEQFSTGHLCVTTPQLIKVNDVGWGLPVPLWRSKFYFLFGRDWWLSAATAIANYVKLQFTCFALFLQQE